jgi:homeobox protein cut-like
MTSASDQELMSSLQSASQSWVNFDWPGKYNQWEYTSSQNKEAREQSQVARKALAETTKQFKRSVKNVEQAGTALGTSNSPENASAAVGAIDSLAKQCRLTVKSYQEEIDNLTRRCKASESAFGNLHQSLNEVPDPAAVLSASMDLVFQQQQQIAQLLRTVDDVNKEMANMSVTTSRKAESTSGGLMGKEEKEELMRLRREVAEYEVEFRSLKNQDITIRKLEARIVELQEAGEEELKEQLEKAKHELAETEGRRATEALEREAAMERRVQTLELQLKAELAGKAATQTHMLEANEGADEREAAWEAQRRILVDDGERLRETLHQATRERDELRLRVAALEGGNPRSATASGGIGMADLLQERNAYEAELSELSHTANSLREEIRHKEVAHREERQSLQATLDAFENEKARLYSNLASLETQLAAAPSQSLVDSMKRELRVLKRLEYNAEHDAELGERDPEMTGFNEDQEKDLESVLVAKLRRMESDMVKERNGKLIVIQQCEDLRQRIQELEMAKQDADKLITSLEADLDKAISAPASPRKSRKVVEAVVLQESSDTLERVLDPNAPPPPPKLDVAKKTATEKAEDDHSVATIIMAQRDRLRARCEALEAERDSFKRELQTQVQAAESLKTDNTKLFEKMRYLQSYNSAPSSGRGAAYGRGGKGIRDRDLDLEALEQRYEASVDPFRQFSRSERQRKLKEMSPMERTVFVVAKAMLGTKEMRAFLFVYVVAMHLLVFLTTYHWSHSDSAGCMENKEHLSHLPPVVAKTAEQIVKDLSGT